MYTHHAHSLICIRVPLFFPWPRDSVPLASSRGTLSHVFGVKGGELYRFRLTLEKAGYNQARVTIDGNNEEKRGKCSEVKSHLPKKKKKEYEQLCGDFPRIFPPNPRHVLE